MNYNEAQDVVKQRIGIKKSTASLADEWDSLVRSCETGYSWDFSEYLNEIQVRDQIEHIISAPELNSYPEHSYLKSLVNSIDDRFRLLLQSDCFFNDEVTWWRRGVLRFAGEYFSEYCMKGYGIRVQIKE